jgi:hypothetical protein
MAGLASANALIGVTPHPARLFRTGTTFSFSRVSWSDGSIKYLPAENWGISYLPEHADSDLPCQLELRPPSGEQAPYPLTSVYCCAMEGYICLRFVVGYWRKASLPPSIPCCWMSTTNRANSYRCRFLLCCNAHPFAFLGFSTLPLFISPLLGWGLALT